MSETTYVLWVAYYCAGCDVTGRNIGTVPICWNCMQPATETDRELAAPWRKAKAVAA